MKPIKKLVQVISVLGCLTIAGGSAYAQSQYDLVRGWCEREYHDINLSREAVEIVRSEHGKGIRRLPANVQPQATKNLYQWYWKKMAEIERRLREVHATCDDPTRRDPDITKVTAAKGPVNRNNPPPSSIRPKRSRGGLSGYNPRPQVPFSR